jgi:hypothetical protein
MITAYVLQDQTTKRYYTARFGRGLTGWTDSLSQAWLYWVLDTAEHDLKNGHGFRGEKNAAQRAITKVVPVTLTVGAPL